MRLPTTISKKQLALVGLFLLLALGTGIAARRIQAVSPDPYLVLAPVGPQSQSELGSEVARAGDVDGDGTPDFISGMLVAATTDTGNTIAARVYSGRTGAILHEIARSENTDFSYNSVAGLGDLDGDGFADFAIGTPGANLNNDIGEPSLSGSAASDFLLERIGLARVFSGKTGALLWSRYGDFEDDFFGRSVSGVSDVNADGVPDLIVGAHGHDLFEGPSATSAGGSATTGNEVGRAYLFSGVQDIYNSTLCVLNGGAPGENFGTSVAGVGDVNGDGRGDFVVGAPMTAGQPGPGRVYLFAGASGECQLLHTWQGQELGDSFGYAVANAGDLTGDGIADVIVGAPHLATSQAERQPAPGRAYLFSGSAADDYRELVVFNGHAPNDLFGFDVAGNGFCNADSVPDLIVGAPQDVGSNESDFAGAAFIYSGDKHKELLHFNGRDTTDLLGASVDWVGQLAGDAPPDEMVVGLQGREANGQLAAGSANVLSCQKLPRPEIEVSSTALDLGTIAPATTISETVTIRNVGDADLMLSSTELITPSTSADYRISPVSPHTIAPGKAEKLTIAYSPATRGADTGLLHIASNDLDEPDLLVSLTGRAAAPQIVVAPSTIDFGADCRMGIERSSTVTIRNQGNDNLVLKKLDFAAGSSSAFTVLNPPKLPYTLTENAELVLTVRFMPVNNLGDTGTLQIDSNDPEQPIASVTLAGQGKTNTNPVARARYVPQEGAELRAFQFDSGDSSDSDGSIVGYLWDFGDGATSTEAKPLHTYATDGTYIAILTVTDNDGDSDTTSVAVEASATPLRARFYGTVRLPAQRLIPDSVAERIQISAWISGTLRAKTDLMIKQGQAVYALRVPGGPGDQGLEVTFRVEGLPAGETGRWASQSDTELNLHVVLPPAASAIESAQLADDKPRRAR